MVPPSVVSSSAHRPCDFFSGYHHDQQPPHRKQSLGGLSQWELVSSIVLDTSSQEEALVVPTRQDRAAAVWDVVVGAHACAWAVAALHPTVQRDAYASVRGGRMTCLNLVHSVWQTVTTKMWRWHWSCGSTWRDVWMIETGGCAVGYRCT